ncbi:hypothetical protein NKY66_07085 [Sinorhizobium meliloti]|uniref:hypothetical protein n=1 Tax=Rhizobium meliloti TaxID=382 RepID=UPI0039A478C3
MKAPTKNSLLDRLVALGADPGAVQYPGTMELLSIMTVDGISLALLSECAALAALSEQGAKRGRPMGKGQVIEAARRVVQFIDRGYDKEKMIAYAVNTCRYNEKQAETLRTKVNEILRNAKKLNKPI